MIADNGPARPGSGPDSAPMIERAVSSDFRGPVYPDGADMRDEQARTDISGGINVDMRNHRKYLSCDGKHQPHRGQKPLRSAPSDNLL